MPKTCDQETGWTRGKRRGKVVRVGRTRMGKGIFAQRRYQAFAIIGKIEGDVIDDPDYGSEHCFDIGDGLLLEPWPPFRFVNHSCEPNCEFDWFDVTDMEGSRNQRHAYLIALRAIKPGEELTIDYNWSAGAAIPCRCRAATCRGWIVKESQLPFLAAGMSEGRSK